MFVSQETSEAIILVYRNQGNESLRLFPRGLSKGDYELRNMISQKSWVGNGVALQDEGLVFHCEPRSAAAVYLRRLA